jgi:fluoroacetyl-CoA thioesterase
MPLQAGLEHAFDFTVEGDLLTDVGGALATKVLATPWMIGVMERCAVLAVRDAYPPGHASVGFEVCVKHVAGAVEGERCTVRARLREVADGRKLRFDVEVTAGDRVIGIGTHERRLIAV